jgi:DNA-binding XRE family transcriptional regulator
MRTTDLEDATAATKDGGVRLRTEVYDALAIAKGYTTPTKQAAWHGIGRSTMYLLRTGDTQPMASTVMRIAADLGVPVEAIWERSA